jgi:PiT family inorganic phosphate transporter
MEGMTLYIALAAVFGLYMAWGIGANDVANAMATSTGAKAITFKQAFFIAAIFEFAGAVLAGGEVTATIRSGMIDTADMAGDPKLLIYGMLASLLAAAVWLNLASRNGWPVSTTHSIVGAIIGFAVVGIGIDAVKWDKVGTIVMSWVVSPLVAGVIAFLIFRTVQALILDRDNPLDQAKRWVPVYMFFAAFNIALVTLLKGLTHVGLDLDVGQTYLLAVAIGLTVAIGGWLAVRRIRADPAAEREHHFATVERVFGVLMVITACSMAFAHGSNDVANAVGPVAAIISTATTGQVGQRRHRPGPGHVRAGRHAHRRRADHRADPKPRLCRGDGGRLDHRAGLRHRAADLDHPHAGRRRARGRHGPRHRRDQHQRGQEHLRVLGDHRPRRRPAFDPVLLHLQGAVLSAAAPDRPALLGLPPRPATAGTA